MERGKRRGRRDGEGDYVTGWDGMKCNWKDEKSVAENEKREIIERREKKNREEKQVKSAEEDGGEKQPLQRSQEETENNETQGRGICMAESIVF